MLYWFINNERYRFDCRWMASTLVFAKVFLIHTDIHTRIHTDIHIYRQTDRHLTKGTVKYDTEERLVENKLFCDMQMKSTDNNGY